MNQEIRFKRLLNKVKKRYGIKDKINMKFVQKFTQKEIILRTYLKIPWMQFSLKKKIPTIYIYPNNIDYRLEKFSDERIEKDFSHELIHFLAYKYWNEKDAKELIKVLKLIDKMIYRPWTILGKVFKSNEYRKK